MINLPDRSVSMTRPVPRVARVLRVVACLRAGLFAALLAALAPAHAGKAHVHGLLKMDVTLEGADLSIALEMPLDSLVGYERAPRSDAERRAASEALARMRDGASLFRLDAAAQCVLRSVEVSAPVLEQPAAKNPDGHADLEASYVFRCAQPARLAQLEVLLFDVFRRVDRIEVQAALPQGQRKAVLRKTARRLPLAAS